MIDYAKQTGLVENTDISIQKRYLWTDAFAVCNFLDLYRKTENPRFKKYAEKLIRQVHEVLGKHRIEDKRSGWLGSKDHPTSHGIRIGKPFPERSRDEPSQSRSEWEKDGQYFHYLTKWMHALLQASKFLQQKKYLGWSIDLALASLKFVHGNHMYWKMSIDLSYPLVSSMGQHDPIDGLVTFITLKQFDGVKIDEGIKVFRNLLGKVNYITTDPLGLGGLLFDTYRLYQLNNEKDLQNQIITAVGKGLKSCFLSRQLAFRELGLSIGLSAARKMNVLENYWYLIDDINDYWVKNRNWTEHEHINQVMLATSLLPDGFLEL